MNSLPKTVTRQRRGCDLNPGPSARESSTLTTRLPSHSNTSEVNPIIVFSPKSECANYFSGSKPKNSDLTNSSIS